MQLPNPRENSLIGLNGLPRAAARPSLCQAVQAAIVLPPLPKAPADYYRQLEAKRERREKWLTGRARQKVPLQRALRPGAGARVTTVRQSNKHDSGARPPPAATRCQRVALVACSRGAGRASVDDVCRSCPCHEHQPPPCD